MVQKKITDEDSYIKAAKKAHQQMQAVSKKIKTAKREVALLRKELDEKPPADLSADDKAKYESHAKYFRSFIDADGKRAFKDVERMMVDFHRDLRSSMGLL